MLHSLFSRCVMPRAERLAIGVFLIVDGLWPILLIRTAATAAYWGVLAKPLAEAPLETLSHAPLFTALHRVRDRVLGALTASEGG